MSDKEITIYEAFAELQYEIDAIKKNQVVDIGKFKFKYADLGAIREAVREPMHKWGFSLSQTIEENFLITCLLHKSGEMIKSRVKIPATNDLKGFGAALTYLRRYSIASLLNLVADDDVDVAALESSGESVIKPDPYVTKEEGDEILELVDLNNLHEKLDRYLKARKLKSVYLIKQAHLEGLKTWLMKKE